MYLLRLGREIENEVLLVEKLKQEYFEIPEGLKPGTRNRLRGSIFHDFYSGLEKIFKRIAAELNGGVPKTETWHKDLLTEMSWEMEGMRIPVLSEETMKRLLPFLRFRHVFRNLYGFDLEDVRLSELDSEFPDLCDTAAGEVRTFIAWLKNGGPG
jgi:hypothetical protein